jgi:hypothetical protein
LSPIALHLRRFGQGWGGTASVNTRWSVIIAAMTRSDGYAPVRGAAGARRQLARALAQLDGSRDLVIDLAEGRIPPLVFHVLKGGSIAQTSTPSAGCASG